MRDPLLDDLCEGQSQTVSGRCADVFVVRAGGQLSRISASLAAQLPGYRLVRCRLASMLCTAVPGVKYPLVPLSGWLWCHGASGLWLPLVGSSRSGHTDEFKLRYVA